jgi:hypothetical protein
MDHVNYLLFARRCALSRVEKITAIGMWAKLYDTSTRPTIPFERVCAYAREGACPPDISTEMLVRAIAYYIRFQFSAPVVAAAASTTTTDLIAINETTYTIRDSTILLLDGLLYALVWPIRLAHAIDAMPVSEFSITADQHASALQCVVPWLLDMAANLPNARMETTFKELYCALMCPIAASARHRTGVRSFYEIFRDHNLIAPTGLFEIVVPACSQKTPKSVIATLIAKPGEPALVDIPPVTVLHACAAFSIFAVFLETVCIGAHALNPLPDADDVERVAPAARVTTFKFTTQCHIEENTTGWCNPFTLYFTDTHAFIRGSSAARAKFVQEGAVPSPFYLINEILSCVSQACEPNTKIARAIAAIAENDKRRGTTYRPPAYA